MSTFYQVVTCGEEMIIFSYKMLLVRLQKVMIMVRNLKLSFLVIEIDLYFGLTIPR